MSIVAQSLPAGLQTPCAECRATPAEFHLMDDGAQSLPAWFPNITARPFWCAPCASKLDHLWELVTGMTASVNIHIQQQADREKRAADAETLGAMVREIWVGWACMQPDIDQHPHWLMAWGNLPLRDQEVDRLIGQGIAHYINTGESPPHPSSLHLPSAQAKPKRVKGSKK